VNALMVVLVRRSFGYGDRALSARVRLAERLIEVEWPRNFERRTVGAGLSRRRRMRIEVVTLFPGMIRRRLVTAS